MQYHANSWLLNFWNINMDRSIALAYEFQGSKIEVEKSILTY